MCAHVSIKLFRIACARSMFYNIQHMSMACTIQMCVLPVGSVFLSMKARVARSGLQTDKRGSYLIRPREGHS